MMIHTGVSGNDFWTLGMGTGMANSIPKFQEREWELKFHFGNGSGKYIPDFREREWDVVIPGK